MQVLDEFIATLSNDWCIFLGGGQMSHQGSTIQWGKGELNLRPNVLRTSILTTWLRPHRYLMIGLSFYDIYLSGLLSVK